MSRLGTLIASTLALVGIADRASAAAAPAAPKPDPVTYSPSAFFRYGSRLAEGGNAPEVWGRSAECRRMVRQNRYLRLRHERSQRGKGGPCNARL